MAPVATLVTAAARQGVAQPSTLGVLHSRGRVGIEKINELLTGAPFVLRQNHRTRGLLFDVPVSAPSSQILGVMCAMTSAFCDYSVTGEYRLELFVR